jgi:hypothetical protein
MRVFFKKVLDRLRQTTVNHRFFSRFATACNTNVVSHRRRAAPAFSAKDGESRRACFGDTKKTGDAKTYPDSRHATALETKIR